MSFAFQRMNGEPPFDDDECAEHDSEEFKEICRPAVDYLQKKHHPHARIIIEWDRASLVEDLFGVPFQVPD